VIGAMCVTALAVFAHANVNGARARDREVDVRGSVSSPSQDREYVLRIFARELAVSRAFTSARWRRRSRRWSAVEPLKEERRRCVPLHEVVQARLVRRTSSLHDQAGGLSMKTSAASRGGLRMFTVTPYSVEFPFRRHSAGAMSSLRTGDF